MSDNRKNLCHFLLANTKLQISMNSYKLKLYISDHNKRSVAAIENLTRLIENNLVNKDDLEIIDVLRDVERAKKDHIIATPTLVRFCNDSVTKIFGDFSETEKVLSLINGNIL